MRQQLYTSLAQAYAQARIEAVRDNPSVVVLESPEAPADPQPRGLLKSVVLALMAGLFLGVLLAFLRERVFSEPRSCIPRKTRSTPLCARQPRATSAIRFGCSGFIGARSQLRGGCRRIPDPLSGSPYRCESSF